MSLSLFCLDDNSISLYCHHELCTKSHHIICIVSHFFGEDEIEICLSFSDLVQTIASLSCRHELCTESIQITRTLISHTVCDPCVTILFEEDEIVICLSFSDFVQTIASLSCRHDLCTKSTHTTCTHISHTICDHCVEVFFVGEDEIEICLSFSEFVQTIASLSSCRHDLCTESIQTTCTPISHTICDPCVTFFGEDEIEICLSFSDFVQTIASLSCRHDLCTKSTHTTCTKFFTPAHQFFTNYVILVSQYFLERMRLRSVCPFLILCRN